MNSYFVIDIETSGETLSDAIIELAILHIELEREFYRPKLLYRRVFHYSFPPESSFAKKHHADLYEEAKFAETVTPSHVEASLNEFFQKCNSFDPHKRVMIGSRLPYKLLKLEQIRYLMPLSTIILESKEKEIGDYKYIIDLNMIDQLFVDMYGIKDFSEKLAEIKLDFKHPNSHRHRALFDCYEYLNRLNKYKMYLQFPF